MLINKNRGTTFGSGLARARAYVYHLCDVTRRNASCLSSLSSGVVVVVVVCVSHHRLCCGFGGDDDDDDGLSGAAIRLFGTHAKRSAHFVI